MTDKPKGRPPKQIPRYNIMQRTMLTEEQKSKLSKMAIDAGKTESEIIREKVFGK
jgi:hypothetical protein